MINKKEKKELKMGLQHLSEASAFFFSMESDIGKACAFMADNLLKYGQAYLHDADPFDDEEDYLPKYKDDK
jgi:hypothetical protein